MSIEPMRLIKCSIYQESVTIKFKKLNFLIFLGVPFLFCKFLGGLRKLYLFTIDWILMYLFWIKAKFSWGIGVSVRATRLSCVFFLSLVNYSIVFVLVCVLEVFWPKALRLLFLSFLWIKEKRRLFNMIVNGLGPLFIAFINIVGVDLLKIMDCCYIKLLYDVSFYRYLNRKKKKLSH